MAESEQLQSLESQLKGQRNFDQPPLHLWHPELSGSIPIQINADGVWFHDGGEIKREALVKLFASILRREDDGLYYLVTPAEKWLIEVDLHPLIVVDFEFVHVDQVQRLIVELNTGKQVVVTEENPLFLDSAVNEAAAISLWHGLSAIFSRAAWLRLAEVAQSEGDAVWVESDGERYYLLADDSEVGLRE
ncbi:MAG: DUF1285 domain-containing protein [Halioglobus sp.]